MHVRVIVRVRPLNSNERTRGYNEVTHITPDAQGLQVRGVLPVTSVFVIIASCSPCARVPPRDLHCIWHVVV